MRYGPKTTRYLPLRSPQSVEGEGEGLGDFWTISQSVQAFSFALEDYYLTTLVYSIILLTFNYFTLLYYITTI